MSTRFRTTDKHGTVHEFTVGAETVAEEKPKRIQIPEALFLSMRASLRAVARDSRREDRSLHDTTRTAVEDTIDMLDDYQDGK